MKKAVSILVLLGVIYGTSAAYACSCLPPEIPEIEFSRSDAVFTGRVIKKEDLKENLDGLTYDVSETTFQVIKDYKGTSTDVVVIRGTLETCDYHFETNQEYLVFANKEEDKFYTSICSRTRNLSGASEDLRELEKIVSKSEDIDKDGVLYKIVKYYYTTGALMAETSYREDKKDGISKEYYYNGNLKKEASFKNNKLDGVYKAYYDSENLEEEINYKNGKADGVTRSYFENGKLRSVRNYKNDKSVGIFKYFYDNGTLQSESHYKDGKQDGVSEWYHQNGVLGQKRFFKDCKQYGVHKYYDEKGNLKKEEDYKDGSGEGVWKHYYKNGRLKKIGIFDNDGLKNLKSYDQKGNLISEKIY